MPALLAYSNLLVRMTGQRIVPFTRVGPVALLTLLCATAWEVIAPMFIRGSVADFGDFVAYGWGSIVYLLVTRCCSGRSGPGAPVESDEGATAL